MLSTLVKRNISFVTIHQETYEDLEQYVDCVSNNKCMCNPLQGIKNCAVKAAKGAVMTPLLESPQ